MPPARAPALQKRGSSPTSLEFSPLFIQVFRMKPNPSHEALFFSQGDLNFEHARRFAQDHLHGLDDGELFLEYTTAENLAWEDGRIKSASANTEKGFGLRGVHGESVAYAHGTEITRKALERAAEVARSVDHGQKAAQPLRIAPFGTQQALYTDENPLTSLPFAAKTEMMGEIDAYLRAKDSRVKQVTASLSASWSVVAIVRPDGAIAEDVRPLVRLNVGVLVEQDGRRESGSSGIGGRALYAEFVTRDTWMGQADEALRMALVNLSAVPAPAGDMPVVLGSGWCGVLLHEAIGHGLEGDFNRKKNICLCGFAR